MLVDTEDPKGVLEEVKRLLEQKNMATLSGLERSTGITRNWLSGFMSALVALGIAECKGTRTYKLYVMSAGAEADGE
jgi:DNA-binding IclR family transcriptional regulator